MQHRDRPMTEQERYIFATWLCRLMLVVVLTTLGCSGCTFPRLSGPSAIEVRDYEYQRLVTIRTTCAIPPISLDGVEAILPNGSGSGVRIGGRAVLTAEHVVNCTLGKVRVKVVDWQGREYPAKVVATMDADIARLEVEGLSPIAPVAVAPIHYGTQLCIVVALPEVGRVCGEIQPSSNNGGPGAIRVRLVSETGNSGGGAWNTAGELVGILVHQRQCMGTGSNKQICSAGVTALRPHYAWIARP